MGDPARVAFWALAMIGVACANALYVPSVSPLRPSRARHRGFIDGVGSTRVLLHGRCAWCGCGRTYMSTHGMHCAGCHAWVTSWGIAGKLDVRRG